METTKPDLTWFSSCSACEPGPGLRHAARGLSLLGAHTDEPRGLGSRWIDRLRSLCAHASHPRYSRVLTATAPSDLRPRLYPPPPEHRKAKAFTPREAPPVVMYRSAFSTASLSHGTRSHGSRAEEAARARRFGHTHDRRFVTQVEEWNAGKGVKPVQ